MDIIKVERQDGQVNAKQLRRCGLIPCCVYGGNLTESVSLKMSFQAADQLYRTKRVGSKVSLELEGRLIPAQIKEKKKNHLSTESDKKRAQSIHTES